MSRRFTFLFAAIPFLVNFSLVSPAVRNFDARKHDKGIVALTENDIATEDQMMRHLDADQNSRFVGDLEMGLRRENDFVWQTWVQVNNENSQLWTMPLEFTVHGRIIHYFSAVNVLNSTSIVCGSPYTLDSSMAKINIRVNPSSTATVDVLIGTH